MKSELLLNVTTRKTTDRHIFLKSGFGTSRVSDLLTNQHFSITCFVSRVSRPECGTILPPSAQIHLSLTHSGSAGRICFLFFFFPLRRLRRWYQVTAALCFPLPLHNREKKFPAETFWPGSGGTAGPSEPWSVPLSWHWNYNLPQAPHFSHWEPLTRHTGPVWWHSPEFIV